MSLHADFDLDCIIVGTVVEIIKETEKAPAGLQFLSQTSRKFDFIDLKVVGSKESDLKEFLGKKVKVNNVKIFQQDFSKFYRVDDLSLISLFSPNTSK